MARQGDGRAHLPRLQRRARARHAAAVHRRRQDDPRRRPAATSTSCTRSSARSSRRAAAPTPAGRCSSEIRGRLELLLGIGLDYLNFNRRSGTLSGGESQRIRLSTQIGSGLMGMLYVLDEPSIGLHPKDNVKMIATLEQPARHRQHGDRRRARRGHDPRRRSRRRDGARARACTAATVVVQGTLDDVLALQGVADRPVPLGQRGDRDAASAGARATARRSTVRGARENNLKSVDVDVPARRSWSRSPARPGRARARWSTRSSTRRSGSGWWTRARCPASTTASTGIEHVHKVVNIDQSPIGRNSRSNPATYIGFYDTIRDLFTQAPLVGRARLQAGALQLQRQGRALRGVPGRRRRSRRSSTSCPTSR